MNNACYSAVTPLVTNITTHAVLRMGSRRIRPADVDIVINYGRMSYVRGAVIYAIGRKEMAFCQKKGITCRRAQGLQVVCAPDDDTVITVYRNNDFKGLRYSTNKKTAKKFYN
ncbi:MAG TPA: hypothetical protein DCG34_05555 [Clostridiales bacterium]|nr:hypothetical protein [Clostridiales bacterium]